MACNYKATEILKC